MTKEKLIRYLTETGYFNIRHIEGRGLCAMSHMIFTVAIVYDLDYEGYSGRYCFHNEQEAQHAFDKWDGKEDPSGNWIKHKGIKNYRNPNYIASSEQ